MQKSLPWKNWLFFILGLCAFLGILNFFSRNVRSAFFYATLPLQSFFWEKGSEVSGFFDGIFQGGWYRKENVLLKEQAEVLYAKLAEFSVFQKENAELKKALELEVSQEFKTLGTRMIGKDISRDIVFIDKGMADGIIRGNAVITPSKVAVGEVIEAYDHVSKVRLLSDIDSAFEASILEKDVVGVIKGAGRSLAVFDLVLRDADMQQGDIIVTSHLGSIFPAGFLIGEIQGVEKNDTGTFQRAEVRPLFDMSRSALLFVIL